VTRSENEQNVGAGLSRERGLVNYYQTSGISFGSADILCCGSTGFPERVALLVRGFWRYAVIDSQISCFLIVVPPGEQGAVAEEQIRIEIASPEGAASGEPANPLALGRHLRLVRPPDFQISSLLAIIREAGSRAVVIVGEAAAYRGQNVAPQTTPDLSAPTLIEDLWVPQLHALGTAATQLAKERDVFVVLDAGELSPHRKELRDLLLSVDGCGLLGAEFKEGPQAIIPRQVDKWNSLVKEGRLGAVLKEINDLPSSCDAEKPLLRVQLIHRAGLSERALATIENEIKETEGASPFSVAQLARIAQDAGSSVLAAKLLNSAIDGLRSLEELEMALGTADEIGDADVEQRIAARLEALFPHSPGLHLYRAGARLSTRDYVGAASEFAQVPNLAEVCQLYTALAELLKGQDTPNYSLVLEEVTGTMPEQASRARTACIEDALSRGLLLHALTLGTAANMRGPMARRTARLLLKITERLLLGCERARTNAISDDLKLSVVRIVEYLSTHPDDGETRLGLARLVSVQVCGSLGLPLIITATLDLVGRGFSLRDKEDSTGWSLEELLGRHPFVEGMFAWLEAESPLVPGRFTFPKDLVTESPDQVVPAIFQALDLFGQRLQEESDIKAFLAWLAFGTGMVPHSSDPDQDIAMIELVASRLVLVGRVQLARDLIEGVFQQAGGTPRRARLAWFAMADIYHRVGNNLESLIALACGFASDGTVEPEEALGETIALLRVMRDVGLRDAARGVLKRAYELLRLPGVRRQYQVRLKTIEIQLDVLDFLSAEPTSRDTLQGLLREGVANAQAVLDAGDNLFPVTLALAQLLRIAADMQLSPESSATEMLATLLKRIDPATGALANMLSVPHPSAADVLALVKRLEIARYSEDVGFDVHSIVPLARRLLGGKEAASDPAVAAFAIELLADRAIAVPGWESTASPPAAPANVVEPSGIAKDLSLLGMSVILAGFDDSSRLLRVTVSAGQIGDVVSEEEAVFARERLKCWAKEFPYRYGVDETTLNLFYTSTEGLGLSELPEGRVLFVTDAELQPLPPNLLRIDEELAGQSRRMAAAPSLSWLAAARQRSSRGNGRLSAWISSTEENGETLAMIADRLGPTFEKYGFDVDRGSSLPEGLAGSELAVVAAHGSIVPEGRYFQLVSDDAELRVAGSDLAQTLRNVGVVILFVCSGGRADKHPSSNTIVGLAKQLLDRGCCAVVASPWPLDPRVTYHWLPKFLDVWMQGAPLIDANFEANRAVAQGLGDGPARCLAMSVYGDPLRVRAS